MINSVSGYILLQSGKIHFLKWGNGANLLIAIHGYGSNAKFFNDLCLQLEDYTCVSIDLPHHGNSEWGSAYFDTGLLTQLINALMSRFEVEKVSLVGYSIGGRVCIKITELMPASINKVILLASDGLKFNTFYYFLTNTSLGKSIFTSFKNKPSVYMPIMKLGKNIGIINAVKFNFATRYIRTDKDRELLFRVWSCLSLLIPDLGKLKQVVRGYNIKVGVFMGKQDVIIPLALGTHFKKMIPNADLILFDKGHLLLDAETIPVINKYLHGN